MTTNNQRYKTIKLRVEGSRVYNTREQLYSTPAEVEVREQDKAVKEMIHYLRVTPPSEMNWTFYEGSVTPNATREVQDD